MRTAFFHGLESPSISDKSKYLENTVEYSYAPEMDYKNPRMFDIILNKVLEEKIDLLIGSSMGGWFAYCISTLTGIPTLLMNPAFHSRSIEPFVKQGNKKSKHNIILGKNDDVIDPEETKIWLKENCKGSYKIHMENNDHRTPVGIMVKYLNESNQSVYEMKNFIPTFSEFLNESKDPLEIGLFSKGGKDAVKGTGYANAEIAKSTCKKLDELEKKGEHKHAMSIATTMMNRAETHQHQTPEMREAMKIFKAWIEKNRTT